MPVKFFPRQDRPDEEEVRKRAEAKEESYRKETGKDIPVEAGAEEGDITDYIMPVKGGVRTALRKGGRMATRGLLSKVRDKKRREPKTLDYGKMREKEFAKGKERLGEREGRRLEYTKVEGKPEKEIKSFWE